MARASAAVPTRIDSAATRSTGVTVRPAADPIEIVAQSAQYSTEVSSEPFWREIGDATLARLIEEALRASTDIGSAEARVTGARAERRVSAYDLGPRVTAVGSATRQRASIVQTPGLTGGGQLPHRDPHGGGIDRT